MGPTFAVDSNKENERRSADWDLRFGLRNYFGLIGAQVLSSVFAFAAVWFASRFLGAEGYGRVVAILAAAQVASQISVNWTGTAVAKFGCEEFVKSGTIAKAFWTRLAILLPNTLLVLLTTRLWMPPVAHWLRLHESFFLLVILVFFASVFWLHVQQALQAAKLPRVLGYLLAFERLQIVLLFLVLAITGQASVLLLGAAYVVAPLVASLFGLWRLRTLIKPWFSFDPVLLKSILYFSLPLLPYSIVGYFTTSYLDAFFISHFLSTRALGVYSVAVQLAGTLMQPAMLAGSLLMPFFITLQTTDRETLISRFFKEILPLAVLAWSLLCVVAGVVFSFLLPAVFGEEFAPSARALWPLLVASAVASPSLLGYAPITSARGLTYIGSVCAVSAAVTNVGLNFVLIPKYGLTGCAWATCAAYATMTIMGAWLTQRQLPQIRTWAALAWFPALAGAVAYLWLGNPLLTLLVAIGLTLPYIVARRRQLIASATAMMSLQSAMEGDSSGGSPLNDQKR